MTQHETTFLFHIRLHASISSLLLFLIFLAPFLCASDSFSAASLEQFALSADSTYDPEYLKNTLERTYQASLDQGIKNYEAYAYVLILRWDYEKKQKKGGKDSETVVEGTDYTMTKFLYLRFLIGNALNIGFGYLVSILATNKLITF